MGVLWRSGSRMPGWRDYIFMNIVGYLGHFQESEDGMSFGGGEDNGFYGLICGYLVWDCYLFAYTTTSLPFPCCFFFVFLFS